MKEQYGKWKVVNPEGLTLHESKIHVAFVQTDESDELFVLKTPKEEPESSNFRKENFRNEVKLTALMDHPNIVKVVDYDADCDDPWMVTEYCKGGSLGKADLDNWTYLEKYQCFNKICSGHQYLRSLGYVLPQPGLDNIFLKEDGTPVIGDFERCQELTNENEVGAMETVAFILFRLIAGKTFTMVDKMERDINEKIKRKSEEIETLSKEIEELEAQKEELYKNNT